MSDYVYLDGKYVPDEQAVISVRTHAFMYGTSVFEGVRAYWVPEENQLYVFRMREHFERILNSCKIMHMHPEYTADDMCDITIELLKKNAPKTDTYIRPVIYKSGQTIGPKLCDNKDSLVITTTPLGDYIDSSNGLKVCVSNWRRSDDNAIPARAKISGCYANTALIVTDARLAGFDDAIVLKADGHVAEGSAMNLYLVEGNKLITSTSTDDILIGITRNTIKEIAENYLNLEVIEREIDRTELYVTDGAFYCGTGAQVMPIVSIDNRPVGNGKINELVAQIQQLYSDIVRAKVTEYKHWCTPIYD
ncbi:MAG: branched-chain amino acid transaminase [bacterium]